LGLASEGALVVWVTLGSQLAAEEDMG
jgi:hypothetical protein